MLAIILAVRISLFRQFKRWSSPYLLLAFFFLVGGIHGTLGNKQPEDPNHVRQLITQRQELSITGTLLQSPELSPDKTTLLIDSHQIIEPNTSYPAIGLVRIAVNGRIAPDIQPGDSIICRAWLTPVSTYGVPGAFDYKKFMAQKSIWVTGWAKSPLLVKKIVSPKPHTFKEKARFFSERTRYRINLFLTQTLNPRQSGIYKAILTGDRSGLSPEINESFKASGATHLLAISGIHIGLLALISTFLFTILLKRSEKILLRFSAPKLAAGLSLIPLILYATVAGFGPPVVRSLIMVTVFIVAFICNRQWSISNNIAIAALIILAFDPTLLATASFQLSFCAVSAIALFAPQLKRITNSPPSSAPNRTSISNKIRRWAMASLLISIIASAGTAPIILSHFNRISLLSPITTLLVEPLLCIWSLTLGLFGALAVPLPQLSALIFQAGALGIDLAIAITSSLAKLPIASIWGPAPHPIQTFSWYLLLIQIASWHHPQFQRVKKTSLIIGLAGLAIPAFVSFNPNSKDMQVTVLDVGQGSAVILQLPDKRTFLVDGGQKTYSKSETYSFNVGERIIAPYLWHNQITKLSGVLISHHDADHYNGLSFILERFKPDNLWINSRYTEIDASGADSYSLLLDKAEKLGIAVSTPVQGENLLSGSAAKLVVVSQIRQDTTISKSDLTNDDSLVLRLEFGKKSFLFPSDIEKKGELSIIKLGAEQIDTDVLVAPHHGSKTSSSPGFLEAVSPEVIVVSAGKNSNGIFPSNETMQAYKKIGSKVFLTAESGTVFFKTDGTNLTTTTFF
nr:DNA internalization-related competence protein ComEC/Rec2 [Desulfobulbaceae bacterium]